MSSTNHEARVQHEGLRNKIMSAEQAASFVKNGMTLGIAGFTGAGYPKFVPTAIANIAKEAHARGEEFGIGMLTGASTAHDCDGVLAEANCINFRAPFQSDPALRNNINAGRTHYVDMHLSHFEQQVRFGFYGDMDIALIEAAAITPEGKIIPSMGIGTNNQWLKTAKKIIIEVNVRQSMHLEGMHDIPADIGAPPYRQPIPIVKPDDRIGTPYLECDLDKIIGIVMTDAPDRNSKFADPDDNSKTIASQIIDFLDHEVKQGRLPKNLLPLQSGVGNVANAVLMGLQDSPFDNLMGYTEVLQDGMLDLVLSGKMTSASATALSFSPDALQRFNDNIEFLSDKLILRPQEYTNHPEVIRRLGIIAMNAMIEADIYGNVNSTHIMGTKMMNGIGGSGDFTRSAYISIFSCPSTAKGGCISSIVPMVSHLDHSEHSVNVIITEQGIADLRGKSPMERAQAVIENCAHPDYKQLLWDYLKISTKGQTCHSLSAALGMHQVFIKQGDMRLTNWADFEK